MNSSSKNLPQLNSTIHIRIKRTLDLIATANESIKLSDEPSLVKQYQHLKKGYTKQLLELLEVYELPVNFVFNEAA